MQKVSYTAVILDGQSVDYLKSEFLNCGLGVIPDNFEWMAHHMTIMLGPMSNNLRSEYLDKEVTLTVTSLGRDEKVVAVGVTGFFSKNRYPHVTLAINKNNGGKPHMSNNLTNWEPYHCKFLLRGTIKEVIHTN